MTGMTERPPVQARSSRRRRRDSARVILLDGDGRVLLFRVVGPRDDKPPLWITPGGGVAPGEELVVAAARELEEGTGLKVSVAELGDPVAVCPGEWAFRACLSMEKIGSMSSALGLIRQRGG